MQTRSSRSRWVSLAAVGAVLLLPVLAVALGAGGQETEPAAAGSTTYSAFNGKVTFQTHCVICHGESGKGDGKFADTLRVDPADLTLLAKKNDGVFPAERTYKVIDGRLKVKGHGTQEMPIWGDAFYVPVMGVDMEGVDKKIRELVEYVRMIQEEPAEE